MTKEEYRAGAEDVVYLAACMVNGEKPDAERVRGMDLEQLYRAANRHLLTGIVGYALEAAGVRDPAFVQAKSKAIRKIVLFDTERAAVLAELEKAGIWHMPLKGSILKEYYPKIGMRQMADNDILIDAHRAERVRDIMERLSYLTEHFGTGVHDSYFKQPVCNFEMHRALFAPAASEAVFEYYQNVKDRLVKDDGNVYGYHFTNEDFYIYIIVHEYKHFSNSGTGLRSVLDTYVFLKRFENQLDWDYIVKEVEKLGIAEFEQQNRSLAMHLFGDGTLSTEDETMLQYIIGSGTYGTRQNYVSNRVRKLGSGKKGKLKYLMNRVFLPMESVESGYPFFYRHKALLPVLFVWRILKGLTIRRSMVKAELKALRKYID